MNSPQDSYKDRSPTVNGRSSRVNQFFSIAERFAASERLFLAKLLLDSVVSTDDKEVIDWRALSLASFESDWDNPDDAIYDDWETLYGVPTRSGTSPAQGDGIG